MPLGVFFDTSVWRPEPLAAVRRDARRDARVGRSRLPMAAQPRAALTAPLALVFDKACFSAQDSRSEAAPLGPREAGRLFWTRTGDPAEPEVTWRAYSFYERCKRLDPTEGLRQNDFTALNVCVPSELGGRVRNRSSGPSDPIGTFFYTFRCRATYAARSDVAVSVSL